MDTYYKQLAVEALRSGVGMNQWRFANFAESLLQNIVLASQIEKLMDADMISEVVRPRSRVGRQVSQQNIDSQIMVNQLLNALASSNGDTGNPPKEEESSNPV